MMIFAIFFQSEARLQLFLRSGINLGRLVQLYQNLGRKRMQKNFAKGSVLLDKYTIKQKLGHGAFGDVYLVEDNSGRLMALKMIDQKKLNVEHIDMLDYLKNQINCMEMVKDQALVELYEVHKDEQYYYMFLEYCDEGDLVNYQSQFPKKVFPLDIAVQYLSQVIKGLEKLHSKGYLHRDIKPQNILIKNQNGAKILKIADFGFAKKALNVQGTVCGTQKFMSPEIYQCGVEGIDGFEGEEHYGYEVDMWAFGVVFFFLLNKSYPFEIQPYWSLEQKIAELKQKAHNFSYKQAVLKTKLKLTQNCTQQIEDLFKKIFNLDPEKRIKFHQIRMHPVFRKYFPNVSQESVFLYKQKFQSTLIKSKVFSTMKPLKAPGTNKETDLKVEQDIVKLQLEEIQFLWHFMDDICSLEGLLGASVTNMTAYNVVRYYNFLLSKFNGSFQSQVYKKKHPKQKNLKWKTLFNDPNFDQHKREFTRKLIKAREKEELLSKKCQSILSEIKKINQNFDIQDSKLLNEEQILDKFHSSYRKSTSIVYSKIKNELKTSQNKGLYYQLCICCICHIFDELVQDQEFKEEIFSVYLSQEQEKMPIFSYEKFKKYLKASSATEMIELAQKIITECLGS